jgi:hypothetical protein
VVVPNAEVQALITKAVKEGGDAAKLAATVKDLEGHCQLNGDICRIG